MYNIKFGVAARYKFEAVKLDPDGQEIIGTRRDVTDWFNNLITDSGLDLLGGGGIPLEYFVMCKVGSGSTTPTNTDTGLEAVVASTTTQQALTNGTSGAAPYYGYVRKTFRFATGTAAGNLTEVGIFGGPSNTVCFSRALIKNGSGDPITITILSDEVLDVIYEFRSYAPAATTYGPITISSVDYSGNISPGLVTTADYGWGGYAANGCWGPLNSYGTVGVLVRNDNGAWNTPAAFATQTLGDVTSYPAGTVYYNTSVTASAYTNGNLYRDHEVLFDLNQGNTGSGIGSIFIPTSFGAFQMSFTPVLDKISTKRLKLQLRVSWGRYVA